MVVRGIIRVHFNSVKEFKRLWRRIRRDGINDGSDDYVEYLEIKK